MAYYIAIDSGGTKTEAVLADESGHILHRTTGCGCNPMNVGVPSARSTLVSTVKQLQRLSSLSVDSIYAGIAGANHADIIPEKELEKECGIPLARIEDDRRIVLSGTLGHVNGCGLICGTGSSLSILIDQEPVRQVGGLGYPIDTGGSGSMDFFSGTNKFPYGPKRGDHLMRKEEEAARMPEGYPIDL